MKVPYVSRNSWQCSGDVKTWKEHQSRGACRPGGGGVLPYKRLMGMCRWMGSHFHDWSDYNGVAFSIELLEWGRKFSAVWGK